MGRGTRGFGKVLAGHSAHSSLNPVNELEFIAAKGWA